ncbi:cytochrome P450 [Streptomyces xanthophaeus]|uniref:cytochrome P450 n=1 Tax=Streptomyces xanthophaeus TaxID=67385 RepID=UPI003863F43B|nr:cytochrome P450 [Streptomyces xanthophaeus]WST63681.1 cytochrome P450 [Streptomyces xanthophaeus]
MTTTAPTPATTARGKTATGPRGVPVLGNLPQWKGDTAEFLLRAQRDHGEVSRLRLGPYTVHLVTEPDAVSRVLRENSGNYVRGALYEQFRTVMGEGLLTTDGDYWKAHRRAVQPVFLRKAVTAVEPNVVRATNEMLDEWEVKARRGEPVDLVAETLRLTLVTLSRALFGYDIRPATPVLKDVVNNVIEVMFKHGSVGEMLPSWMPTRRNRLIARDRRIFTRLVTEIRDHHASTGEGPLMELIEAATDPVTGARWSDEEIRDEMLTIYLAGHETTAVSLLWTLVSIANHPGVAKELDEELARELGGAVPTAQDVERLRYTQQVVDESLRMYPPIWIYPRDAVADDELAGFHIPGGSSVLLSPLVSHRNPRFWDNPEAFDPHRFDPDRVKERPRMAYFPFGAGARMCIGNFMALLELRMIVAMIHQRFRLSLVPGDFLRYGDTAISLRPRSKVMVLPQPRERGTRP